MQIAQEHNSALKQKQLADNCFNLTGSVIEPYLLYVSRKVNHMDIRPTQTHKYPICCKPKTTSLYVNTVTTYVTSILSSILVYMTFSNKAELTKNP